MLQTSAKAGARRRSRSFSGLRKKSMASVLSRRDPSPSTRMATAITGTPSKLAAVDFGRKMPMTTGRTTLAALPRSAVNRPNLETRKPPIASRNPSPVTVSRPTRRRPPTIMELQTGNKELKEKVAVMEQEVRRKNEELAEKIRDLDHTKERLAQVVKELEDSKSSARSTELLVQSLQDEIVNLKGQIRIAVRVRPLIGDECASDHIAFPGPSTIAIDMGNKVSYFEFQHVFGPCASQAAVFEDLEQLILSVLRGYNVSVIAYGQTGSGKTHTMRGGYDEAEGVIPRAVKTLLSQRDKMRALDWEYSFSASYFEVYNEEVYDLMAKRTKIDLRTTSGPVQLEGVVRVPISSTEQVRELMAASDRYRSTTATKSNQMSSRSHALFELTVEGENRTLGKKSCATLYLVDLAGSERAKETGAEGLQFKELTFINQGLSRLKNCIRKQAAKSSHIPYRESKLTLLLKESLGAGNSKTLMMVNLNPSISQVAETKRSLEFAQEVGKVVIGAAQKHEIC